MNIKNVVVKSIVLSAGLFIAVRAMKGLVSELKTK